MNKLLFNEVNLDQWKISQGPWINIKSMTSNYLEKH
jgi:hypothetical protein